MADCSDPLVTPGKHGEPCAACSPVKYDGVTTYVCGNPRVVVQRITPKKGDESEKDSGKTVREKKIVNSLDVAHGDANSRPRRGRANLSLKKGKTSHVKSLSLSKLRETVLCPILNSVDNLNESDDFSCSAGRVPTKRRKVGKNGPSVGSRSSGAKQSSALSLDVEVDVEGPKAGGTTSVISTEAVTGQSSILSLGGTAAEGPNRVDTSSVVSTKAVTGQSSILSPGSTAVEGPNNVDTSSVASTEAGTGHKCEDPDRQGLEGVGSGTDEDRKMCVICQLSVGSEDLQTHLKSCLNKHFTRGGNPIGDTESVPDEVLAKQLQQAETVQSCPPLELVLCQICNLDLSDLSPQTQMHHVNACMDKAEAEEKTPGAEAEALERARKAVLDCPMCGKPLKTVASRKSHLNRCAKALSVGRADLSQLIEQQRMEYELKLVAGVIPLETRSQKTKTQGQKRKTTKPSNELDEDTQFAMALSTSMIEEQQKQENQLLEQLESINRLALGCKKVDKDLKKGRKKKGKPQSAEEIPQLLKYSTEEIRKQIAERVAMIVTPVDMEQIDSTPPMTASIVGDKGAGTNGMGSSRFCSSGSSKGQSLWKRSCINSDVAEMYYVEELRPFVAISCAQAGRLLRKISDIPGRRKSEENDSKMSPVIVGNDDGSSVDFASTQTAVLLAELAAEEGDSASQLTCSPSVLPCSQNIADQHSLLEAEANSLTLIDTEDGPRGDNSTLQDDAENPAFSCSGFCPENGDEVKVDTVEVVRCLQNQLLSMVNNPLFSDIQLKTRNGEVIHGHRMMIAARCPQLTQVLQQSSDDLHLEEFSSTAVLNVMKFVYAGELQMPNNFDEELCVAERLAVKDLTQILHQQKSVRGDSSNELDNKDVGQEETINDLLNSMFEETGKPGSGHAIDDGLQEEDDKDDEEMDSLYQFMCTQREKSSSAKGGNTRGDVDDVISDGPPDENDMCVDHWMSRDEQDGRDSRGVKRDLDENCDVQVSPTENKRLKLDDDDGSEGSSSKPEACDQQTDTASPKPSSSTYSGDTEENHFEMVHSMLNELSPGEAENYQSDWLKNSSNGEVPLGEGSDQEEYTKTSEYMDVSSEYTPEIAKSGDKTKGELTNIEKETSEGNSEQVDPERRETVDVTASTSVSLYEEGNAGSLKDRACSEQGSPLRMSIDSDVTPELLGLADSSSGSDKSVVEMTCTGDSRSKVTVTPESGVNDGGVIPPQVQVAGSTAANQNADDERDVLSASNKATGENTDVSPVKDDSGSINTSDSWLIPDTPIKFPALSGRSTLIEDKSRTFNSKCPDLDRETDVMMIGKKSKVLSNNNGISADSVWAGSVSMENGEVCDISKCQPSFTSAFMSTPVPQRTYEENRHWKMSRTPVVSIKRIDFVPGNFTVMLDPDKVKRTPHGGSPASRSDGVDSDVEMIDDDLGDQLVLQQLSNNVELPPSRSKNVIDVEFSPEEKHQSFKDVDNFFARSPVKKSRKKFLLSKLKQLPPRAVQHSNDISASKDCNENEELPDISKVEIPSLGTNSFCEKSNYYDLCDTEALPKVISDPDGIVTTCPEGINPAGRDPLQCDSKLQSIGIQSRSGNGFPKQSNPAGKKYTFKKVIRGNNNHRNDLDLEKMDSNEVGGLQDIPTDNCPHRLSPVTVSEDKPSSPARLTTPPPLIDCSDIQPVTPPGMHGMSQDKYQGDTDPPQIEQAMSEQDNGDPQVVSPSSYQDLDVWEDFDDAGVGFDPGQCESFHDNSDGLTLDKVSPARNDDSDKLPSQDVSCAKPDSRLTEVINSSPEVVNLSPVPVSSSPDIGQPACHSPDSGPPSDFESPPPQVDYLDQFEHLRDPSPEWLPNMAAESSCPQQIPDVGTSEPSEEHSFTKTPKCLPKTSRKAKKKWVPPSPFTPMADYDRMNTPQLKKEIQKFGIKPVSKKRMIVCLKDIYQQTHQYETDSEAEVSVLVEEVNTADPAVTQEDKTENKDPAVKTKTKGKSGRPAKNGCKTIRPTKPASAKAAADNPPRKTVSKSARGKSAVVSAAPPDVIDLSQEEGDSDQEDASSASDMMEETFLMEGELLCSQQESSPDLHQELHTFFTSNPELYSKVLMYEPLEFDWLREEIKKAGIKCSMPKLIHFMDERCITFTMKSRRADKPRGRRKKAKKTAETAVS